MGAGREGGPDRQLEIPSSAAGYVTLLSFVAEHVDRPKRLRGRGADRQLNRALHTIVMIRQRYHEPTKTYTTRRIAQGKSQRDVRRCLKRTLARQLFRLLERQAPARVTA